MINLNRGRAGRRRKGSIVTRIVRFKDEAGKQKTRKEIFARVTFAVHDPTGTSRRKDKLRRARNVTHARELIQDMLRELDDYGEGALDHKDRTFNDLADYYATHYLTKVEYDKDDKKVSGLRSLATPKGFLKTLRAHFGKRRLIEITYGDVRKFRSARLKAPTRGDIARHTRELSKNRKAELRITRAVASTNRELALLHRMFNVALQEGWIRRHPMKGGDALISVAGESKRERILTLDEETRLLAACTGKREHLRTIVIAALDSGMRKGELLKLLWPDIDLAKRVITVRAFNTKTMRARSVAMTIRLTEELERRKALMEDPDARVFGVDDVKRSFDSARRAAELPDVRFHDLRHTYATRLISRHVPSMEVGRLLGHQQANTTYRYVNATEDTARRAADALDAMRSESEAVETPATETVN
jgi:integrase